MSMTTILLFGGAGALLVLAIVVMALTGKQKKAEKWEKAQIVKRLVALSEQENPVKKAASQPPTSRKPAPARRAAAGRGV